MNKNFTRFVNHQLATIEKTTGYRIPTYDIKTDEGLYNLHIKADLTQMDADFRWLVKKEIAAALFVTTDEIRFRPNTKNAAYMVVEIRRITRTPDEMYKMVGQKA